MFHFQYIEMWLVLVCWFHIFNLTVFIISSNLFFSLKHIEWITRKFRISNYLFYLDLFFCLIQLLWKRPPEQLDRSLFPDTEERFSTFYFEYNINCGLVILSSIAVIVLKYIPSIPNLLIFFFFGQKEQKFSNAFSASIERIRLFLSFILLNEVSHTYRFSFIEPSLHLWNKYHLNNYHVGELAFLVFCWDFLHLCW
jgi:hypothetical protein